MENMNKNNRYMPLIMALCVVVGIMIGTFYANHFSGNRLNIINSGSSRLNDLLHIIEDQYVDKVNIDSLVDGAIPQILAELDPHSVYISAKEVQTTNDELKGSFSGVGIEFTINEDTIRVQNVIKNGPAERAGILAVANKALRFTPTKETVGKNIKIVDCKGKNKVWTLANNTLTAHSVTIGQSDGIHTEIIKGLKKGQKIVTEIIVNTPEENEEPQQSQGLISGPGPRGKKK